MDIMAFNNFLIDLGFRVTKHNVTQIIKTYTLGKYQINFTKDFYGVCSMSMFYNNIEVITSVADIIYLNTEPIVYSFINIFKGDNDDDIMEKSIKNKKCEEELIKYIENNTCLKIKTADIIIKMNDNNIKFTIDNTPIYIFKRNKRINEILEKYSEEEQDIMYNDKFIELKTLLDERIKEERIKKNVLFEFCIELTKIGFKAYKNNTIFKYTDDVRIVIREKSVELYYFGSKESFKINGYLLVKITDYISSIEAQRK